MTTDARSPGFRFRGLLIDSGPLRANRPYRLVFAALSASLLVYGVLGVATSWQAFAMTGSSLQVALVGAFGATGLFAGSLCGGVLADRCDRRLLMLWSRTVFLGVVIVLALNAARTSPSLSLLYGAAAAGGLAGGISAPALMAAVPTLIGREHLAAAGALAAIMAQLGGIVGSSIAGMLIAGPGLVFCYVLVACGAALTPALLWFLPAMPPRTGPSDKGFQAFSEGFRFLRSSPLVSGLLLIDLAAFLFAVPHVLIPQIATDMLRGGPAAAGLLYSAPAVGAFLAALLSGWARHTDRPGIILIAATLVWGAAVLGSGLSGNLTVTLILFAIAGASNTVAEILRGALLQAHTPDHLRGRVSSLWLMLTTGGPALGGMQMGAMARFFSPATALLFGGAACIAAGGAAGALLPALRRATLRDSGGPGRPPRDPVLQSSTGA